MPRIAAFLKGKLLMFIKSFLAKFEWINLPEELTDLDVEGLLLGGLDYNFAASRAIPRRRNPDKLTDNEGEYWGTFTAMGNSRKYGRPLVIMQSFANGTSRMTNDFCLFDNRIKSAARPQPVMTTIKGYSALIAECNRVIHQHIKACELVAAIYASSPQEATDLEKMYGGINGVKVIKTKQGFGRDYTRGDVNYIQFAVTPRGEELESLKHELENDLFLRLGIDAGIDKTHITNDNINDSEQPAALVNAYYLKLHKDFCKRYNTWAGRAADNLLDVRIHNINASNTIKQSEGPSNDNGGN